MPICHPIICSYVPLWYGQVEMGILETAYRSLVRQMNTIFRNKLWYVMIEQFLMKYVWSGCGMVIISLPLLLGNKRTGGHWFSTRLILVLVGS